MLLKTILIIFFLYIAMQVLGVIFRTRVIIKNFNYNDQRQQRRPEGEVTIDGKNNRESRANKGQVGEYVDYEEIK